MLQDVLANIHPGWLCLLVIGGYFGWRILRTWIMDWKVRRLGGRALSTRKSKWPYIGCGLDICLSDIKAMRNHGFIEHYGDELMKYNHTMSHYALGEYAIITDEPENIKAVLATSFEDWGKGQQFHDLWKDFLGDSIFATDGYLWKTSRRLLQPQFIVSRVSDLDCIERSVSTLINIISTATDKEEAVDMYDLFMRLTIDTATDFLFGECLKTLDNPKEEFAWAFNRVQFWQGLKTVAGPLAAFNIDNKEFKKCLRIVNDFLKAPIKKALNTDIENLQKKSEKEYTLLDALSLHTRDPKMLRDQIIATLLAARDTTATTMSWAFYELSRRPDIFEKLRQEVLSTVGTERLPTYDDLKKMGYLKHFINEVLRLYPPVPMNIRQAQADTYLPRGGGNLHGRVGCPKGTAIVYSVMTMHRRKDLVGPDADEFKPERWKTWIPKPWTYLPFNGGPRICLGQTFALAQMQYTIARLVQSFSAVQNRQDLKQRFVVEILLRPEHPVLCQFKK